MDTSHPLTQLKILHAALVGGVVLFGGICLLMNLVLDIRFNMPLPEYASYLVFAAAAGLLLLGRWMYDRKMSGVEQGQTLAEKLSAFREASLLRFILVETAAIAPGMAYLMSADISYLLIMALATAYFINIRPTALQMEEELQLSYTQKQELNL